MKEKLEDTQANLNMLLEWLKVNREKTGLLTPQEYALLDVVVDLCGAVYYGANEGIFSQGEDV